jgi:hypothetical protein
MKIFRKLNLSLGLQASRDTGDTISNLQYAEVACSQLARAKLGLKHSAEILLDIIKAAQVGRQCLSHMRNHYSKKFIIFLA